MIKEKIIAIILGVVFGITTAVFIVSFSNKREIDKRTNNSVLNKAKVVDKVKNSKTSSPGYLEITSPHDNFVTKSDNIEIKGKAPKNSLIIIQSPIKDLIFKNNQEEKFSKNFPLALGENVISIVIYNKDIQTSSLERDIKIYYLKDND